MAWTFLLCLLVVNLRSSSLSLNFLESTSRADFLKQAPSSVLSSFLFQHRSTPLLLQIPLQFLPTAGCLCMTVVLDNKYRYQAILDTGSPFLTAPPSARAVLERQPKKALISSSSSSSEQYGDAVGNVEWYTTNQMCLYDTSGRRSNQHYNMQVGIPSSNVLQDTGGVFFGLIQKDLLRPTVLQQLNMNSFVLDYVDRTLTLGQQNIHNNLHVETVDLYSDFSKYGSNVHHYGVLCNDLRFVMKKNGDNQHHLSNNLVKKLSRPLIVVLDSGLTGCVVSESLKDELVDKQGIELSQVSGAQIKLGDSTILSSSSKYWSLTSIRLPWFDIYTGDNYNKHPHILAAGGTFLHQSRIAVDNKQRTVQIW